MRAQPGARDARAGGRGADRGPPRRPPQLRDRADRRGLPAGGAVKANWQGISGGAGVEEAVAGFFDELGGGGLIRPDGRSPAARARVLGARRRAGAARGRAHARLPDARARALGARGLRDRADGPDPARGEPARARRSDARAAARRVRRARALGRHGPRRDLGAVRDVLVPSFSGSTRSSCACRSASTSSWRRDATSRRCRTARSRSRSTSAARSSTAARRTGCRSRRCRGTRRRSSAAGRDLAPDDRRALPRGAFVRLGDDTFEALRRYRWSAGCPRSTRRWRSCSPKPGQEA